MNTLPNELVDLIASKLHKSDQRSLRLVCRAYGSRQARSAQLLFRDVDFFCHDDGFRWLQSIARSPELCKHVRQLTFHPPFFDSLTIVDLYRLMRNCEDSAMGRILEMPGAYRPEDEDIEAFWLTVHGSQESIQKVLMMFSNLETIKINGNYDGRNRWLSNHRRFSRVANFFYTHSLYLVTSDLIASIDFLNAWKLCGIPVRRIWVHGIRPTWYVSETGQYRRHEDDYDDEDDMRALGSPFEDSEAVLRCVWLDHDEHRLGIWAHRYVEPYRLCFVLNSVIHGLRQLLLLDVAMSTSTIEQLGPFIEAHGSLEYVQITRVVIEDEVIALKLLTALVSKIRFVAISFAEFGLPENDHVCTWADRPRHDLTAAIWQYLKGDDVLKTLTGLLRHQLTLANASEFDDDSPDDESGEVSDDSSQHDREDVLDGSSQDDLETDPDDDLDDDRNDDLDDDLDDNLGVPYDSLLQIDQDVELMIKNVTLGPCAHEHA